MRFWISPTLALIAFLTSTSCGRHFDKRVYRCQEFSSQTNKVIVGLYNWEEISTSQLPGIIKTNSAQVGQLSIPRKQSRCVAFVVAPKVVLTNHHCIEDSAMAAGATLQFNQHNHFNHINQPYLCDKVLLTHPGLDITLLQCPLLPSHYSGLPLLPTSTGDLKTATTAPIYVLHHNCLSSSSLAPTNWADGGDDCHSSAKFSPGYLLRQEMVEGNLAFVHDADTLAGSSGSPVFSAGHNAIIGVHKGGDPQREINFAVPMENIFLFIRQQLPTLPLKTVSANITDQSVLNWFHQHNIRPQGHTQQHCQKQRQQPKRSRF